MRYLQKTKDYMLTYKRSDHLEVVGYSDSDFVRCQDSRKSTSSYTYLLTREVISWKSVKQTLAAFSTMGAELQIFIEHIGTNSMIADPLTKSLPPKVFYEHTAYMSVTLFEDVTV
ncbi:hypothetical protein V6Z12_A12G063400 [Gossypium hirsutum]